jgi:hypothetical protein
MLRGLDHGLYYPRCPGEAHLVGYSDSDHAGDIDTSKSTSGVIFFFGKCLVSWHTVKQQVVALSSYEAEYIAASTTSTQVIWPVQLLSDLLGRDTGAGLDHAVFEQGASAGNVGNENILERKKANPVALLLSSAMMLRHLQFPSFADRLEMAVKRVIAEGKFRTKDLGGTSTTQEVSDAVIANLD